VTFDGGGGAVVPDALATATWLRLKPGVSKSKVITCWPAVRETGTFTVVQFCHPPVAGIVTTVHTLLPLKPRCSDPPPAGDATRSCAT
jgi:hypothetical protein